jgi:UDP-2-acetamido-3-amino-2,3-dideoxy-glucuronate N-acetyltransferase
VDTNADFESAFTSDSIDAIVIATPAETHHVLAIQGLAAGKDVFVEKPLALTYTQGAEIQAEAERRGRILMVGHLLEYHPAVLRLRELVTSGGLGRVNYIYSNRLNFGKIRTEENALWSFAPHDIAVILRLAGEVPIQVTCSGGSYVTPNLADVTVSCLQFSTGLRAHIFVSWLNPFKEQKLVVVGDRRMAVFNDTAPADQKLVLFDQRVDLENRKPVLQKGEMQAIPLDGGEPLRRECEHFLDCIRSRRPPLTDGRSAIDVLRGASKLPSLASAQRAAHRAGCSSSGRRGVTRWSPNWPLFLSAATAAAPTRGSICSRSPGSISDDVLRASFTTSDRCPSESSE